MDFGKYDNYFKYMGVILTITQITDGIKFLYNKYGKRVDEACQTDEKQA